MNNHCILIAVNCAVLLIISPVLGQFTHRPDEFTSTTDMATTTWEQTTVTTTPTPTTTGATTTSTDATTTAALSTTTYEPTTPMPLDNSFGLQFAYNETVGDSKLSNLDDGCSPGVRVDYGIPYKNITFTKIYVCVNGLLCLSKKFNGYSIPRNGQLIKNTAGVNCLAPYMTDFDTTHAGRIWYQLYDTTEDNSVQSSAIMKKISDMVYKEYNEAFNPIMAFKATWYKVPRYLQSLQQTATFQTLLASDGIDSYAFYMYEYGEMKLSSGGVFIGLITNSFATGFENDDDNSYLLRPDTNLKIGDHLGVASYKLTDRRHQISNRLQCKLWHRNEVPHKEDFARQLSRMPLCPCTDVWLAYDPFFMFPPWYLRSFPTYATYMIPNSRFGQFSKSCVYDSRMGTFIGWGDDAGTLFKYSSLSLHASSSNDLYMRDLCCEYKDTCKKYLEVRPPESRCYRTFPFSIGFGIGDPHMISLDGARYRFNGHSEYILTKITEANFQIQCRTSRTQKSDGSATNATVFTAFAVQGNGTYLQVELNINQIKMNVYAGTSKRDGDWVDYSLPFNENGNDFLVSIDGMSLTRFNETLKAAFTNTGVMVNISLGMRLLAISISLHESYKNTAVGLLGNFNGNDSDDFIPRGSVNPLNNPNERTIFHEFGQTWATYWNESIFKYDYGMSHSSYSFPNFTPTFLNETNSSLLAEAEAKCGGAENRDCVFDFIVTGNEQLALSTQDSIVQAIQIIDAVVNSGPNLTVTSGAHFIDGNYYIYAKVGKTYNISFTGADKEGPVQFELVQRNDTYKPLLVSEPNGTATLVITLPNLNPVYISIVSKDSAGLRSSSMDLITVACTGCSSHGTCNFTTFLELSGGSSNFRIASCVCEMYWEGDNCENDTNECAYGPCIIGQSCKDTAASAAALANSSLDAYKCSECPTGYSPNGDKCIDINECLWRNPCTYGACQDTEGSFICVCSNGYRLGSTGTTCDDINECDDSTSGCDQICDNHAGSYTCDCYAGHQWDNLRKRCINDSANMPTACEMINCSTADGCRVTDGLAECICVSGYMLQSNNNTCADIDECRASSKTICSQNCANSVGSFSCSCYVGYQLDSDQITCTACKFPFYGKNCISTCSCGQGSERCDHIHGCICLPGWTNTSCNTDINECSIPNVCGDRMVCLNTFGSYICACMSGYTLSPNGSCTDVNECADDTLNTCEQTCTNVDSSFTCGCTSGYIVSSNDTTKCEDIDECKDGISECQQLCINAKGTYNCQCYLGYVLLDDRKQCIPVSDICQAYPTKMCSDICTIENDQPVCYCNLGYKLAADGRTCFDTNECLNDTLNLCTVKESCRNSNGSFSCSCNDGYQLNNDKITCTKCDTFHYGANCANVCNCGVGATYCDRVSGCVCQNGWSGTKCDMDKDECAAMQSPCNGANELCVNHPGSYQCMCMNGYQRNSSSSTCEDIDECNSNILNTCDQICTNTAGSFVCSCNTGFTDTGNQCNDIDECSGFNKCQQVCNNNIGSYRCSCRNGFNLNQDKMSCDVVIPCITTVCGLNSYCADINNIDTCLCKKGYEFITNSNTSCSDIKECSRVPRPCSQVCTEMDGTYACSCNQSGFKLDVDNSTCIECDEGKYGKDCLATCNCSYAMGNTKACNKANGFCQCNAGWNGSTCNVNINECFTLDTPCPSNSACLDLQGSYECICSLGYFKTSSGTCEACDHLHYGVECVHNCSCIAANTDICDPATGACVCLSGWEGATCNLNKNECIHTPGICNDTLKTCTDTVGSYACNCINGYTKQIGDVCTDDNECLLGTHNCLQQCVNKPGTYSCACSQGFTGTYNNCTDILECSRIPSPCSQKCTEMVGSYSCSCNVTGYKLDLDKSTCVECTEGTFGDGCLQNCVCANAFGNTKACNKINGSCECNKGWSGADCSIANDECIMKSVLCPLNSVCVNSHGSYACICNPGFTKTNNGSCEDTDECLLRTHNCTQKCINMPGTFECACNLGFSGTGNNCTGCLNNTYGSNCESRCDCIASNAAYSTQTCDNVNGACSCKKTWTGIRCEVDVDECYINFTLCKNVAFQGCENLVGGHKCSCYIGYIQQGNLCVPATDTTTTAVVTVGEFVIVIYVKLNLTIAAVSASDDLIVSSTNEKYRNESIFGLTKYFTSSMHKNLKKINVMNVRHGSININFTATIADTEISRQQLSLAIYDLWNGSIVTLFDQPTSASEIAVNGTNLESTSSETSIKCWVYKEINGICKDKCVVEATTRYPSCQPLISSDKLPLILGLSIGIPLFVIAIIISIIGIIYCCRVRRKTNSSEDDHSLYRTAFNNGFFPAVIPKKFSSVHSSDPFASQRNWPDHSSTASASSSLSENNQTHWRRLHDDIPAFIATDDNSHNNEFTEQFSWHFLSNYLKPNESYKIRRPLVSPSPTVR